MPFDGIFDRTPLDDLIAWLETRDPGEQYDYYSTRECLLCRYFAARRPGHEMIRVTPNAVFGNLVTYRLFGLVRKTEYFCEPLPDHFDAISCQGAEGRDEPARVRTVGGALAWARRVRRRLSGAPKFCRKEEKEMADAV